MKLLNDIELGVLCAAHVKNGPMIWPFYSTKIRINSNVAAPVISYGCSSYGYDIRLSPEYEVFTPHMAGIIDPKNFDKNAVIPLTSNGSAPFTVPPNSYILGRSIEIFDMPSNVIGICVGKSTYARCGIIVNVTPLEPGWRGTLTMEIANVSPLPVRLYPNEGICQIIFFQGEAPMQDYGDDSPYQDQGNKEIRHATLNKNGSE
jgi:dCTP deaminase